MYYLQSRYYDPDTGRFINADDIVIIGAGCSAISYNLFAYCENNAPNMCDVGGYAAINIICAAIGAIAGWFFGDYVAKKLGYSSGWKYWAIRAGVVIGGAVIGWFAGSLITKVVASFLKSNPKIVFKIAYKLGASTFANAMKLLGINPFSLVVNSSKFIAISRLLGSKTITIGIEWMRILYAKAIEFGYTITLHTAHSGWGWHIHLNGANGKLCNLHIQITKAAYDFLMRLLH